MAPILTTNTVRFKARYLAFGLPHTINLRFGRGTTGAAAQTAANTMLTAVAAAWGASNTAEDFTWLNSQYSPEDDLNFYPVATLPTNPAGLLATGDQNAKIKSTYVKFTGRGGNRNANFSLYGIAWQQDDTNDVGEDGIATGEELAAVNTAILAIQTCPLVSINNVLVVWNNYVNIKQNDYWRDELKPTR